MSSDEAALVHTALPVCMLSKRNLLGVLCPCVLRCGLYPICDSFLSDLSEPAGKRNSSLGVCAGVTLVK